MMELTRMSRQSSQDNNERSIQLSGAADGSCE